MADPLCQAFQTDHARSVIPEGDKPCFERVKQSRIRHRPVNFILEIPTDRLNALSQQARYSMSLKALRHLSMQDIDATRNRSKCHIQPFSLRFGTPLAHPRLRPFSLIPPQARIESRIIIEELLAGRPGFAKQTVPQTNVRPKCAVESRSPLLT